MDDNAKAWLKHWVSVAWSEIDMLGDDVFDEAPLQVDHALRSVSAARDALKEIEKILCPRGVDKANDV